MLKRLHSLFDAHGPHRHTSNRKSGQAIALILALLIAMAAMAFWIIDTHHSILARLRAQDTGDAAVLAAAKWQAAGVNLIEELNLIHAYMLTDAIDNQTYANDLHILQQRIAITTPILALQAAQVVAQKNKASPIKEAKEFLEEYCDLIQFPTLYPGATEDFRAALRTVLRNHEIYAFPIYEIALDTNSLLGDQDFYEAILAGDYCWFWFNAYPFLQSYHAHNDFGPIQKINTKLFFSLDINTYLVPLYTFYSTPEDSTDNSRTIESFNENLASLNHPLLPTYEELREIGDPPIKEVHAIQQWAAYGKQWSAWTQMRRDNLPIRADVDPEHDILGAYAAISIERDNTPWMAAAKTFPRPMQRPALNDGEAYILLGGCEAVRLVPIDSVGSNLRPFEPAWFRHIYSHILDYSRFGRTFEGCRYCRALRIWDGPAFRISATQWLSLHGHTCRRPKPGKGESGGTRYAH